MTALPCFAGLVGHVDDYQPGALRFDVGQRSNFALIPALSASLDLVLEWRPERLKTSLERHRVGVSFRGSSVRVSPCVYNTEEDVEALVAAFAEPLADWNLQRTVRPGPKTTSAVAPTSTACSANQPFRTSSAKAVGASEPVSVSSRGSICLMLTIV